MDNGGWRLIWSDSSGAVLSGSLDGDVDTLSEAMSGAATAFNLDGDGHDEVLRTTTSSVAAWAGSVKLWSVSLPDDPRAAAFEVHTGDGGSAVGVVVPTLGQVRLIDPAGAPCPCFPLKGAVLFSVADINMDGGLELVTADGDGVVTVYPLPPRR